MKTKQSRSVAMCERDESVSLATLVLVLAMEGRELCGSSQSLLKAALMPHSWLCIHYIYLPIYLFTFLFYSFK